MASMKRCDNPTCKLFYPVGAEGSYRLVNDSEHMFAPIDFDEMDFHNLECVAEYATTRSAGPKEINESL